MTNSKAKAVYLHALTPLHVGTGQAVANLDLPIAREKATGFPLIPASAFKGVLRDYFSSQNWASTAFGSTEQAGALAFTDLHLLCLPVRSYHGTFAYVTCPLVLHRYNRAVRALGARKTLPNVPDVSDESANLMIILPTSESVLAHNGQVYLEDLDLRVEVRQNVSETAQRMAETFFKDKHKLFVERFAIVSDSTFSFLAETATEVVARVRLQDETKTVAQGALWYEEMLPAESLLYGFITVADHFRQDTNPLQQLPNSEFTLQIGGDATIGRGVCRVVIE
jgi:CRISPR-associated protein Cmr4